MEAAWYPYIFWNHNLFEILPPDLSAIPHCFPEKHLQSLQRLFIKPGLRSHVRQVRYKFHNLVRGHLIRGVYIDESIQFVHNPFGLPYLLEFVKCDDPVSAKHIRHWLQLFREVYMLFYAETQSWKLYLNNLDEGLLILLPCTTPGQIVMTSVTTLPGAC